ncbi:MAG: hypothetical protein IJN82_02875, partial [Clostridia bacterium]|nr:hypothetical protein [Clostridia bacterium]
DLAENDLARAAVRTDALGEAAALEKDISKQLGDAYGDFYDYEQQLDLQQMKSDAALQQLQAELRGELNLQKQKDKSDLAQQERDYLNQVALLRLKARLGL